MTEEQLTCGITFIVTAVLWLVSENSETHKFLQVANSNASHPPAITSDKALQVPSSFPVTAQLFWGTALPSPPARVESCPNLLPQEEDAVSH